MYSQKLPICLDDRARGRACDSELTAALAFICCSTLPLHLTSFWLEIENLPRQRLQKHLVFLTLVGLLATFPERGLFIEDKWLKRGRPRQRTSKDNDGV